MRLSWNEIRARAALFAQEWQGAKYEKGESQTFYNEFFEIFGVLRRRVASFEEPVKKLDQKYGFIDLFWKGVLLVEQKSAGKNLTTAKTQAFDYFPGIKEVDLPRYVLVSDFQLFELYDLDEGTEVRFALSELPSHIEAFGFILGVQKRTFHDQDPVNILASELMGRLHDALKSSGYEGHDLERLLVRLLFCLFADDTGIFEPRGIFQELIANRTNADGSDTGAWLSSLFDTLNKPEDKRQKVLDEDLNAFPYVNGDLFKERLESPAFNSGMRKILLEACAFNWDAISPAIFGALFQSVMDAKARRKQGAHYTTERNIMKVIQPLFLDGLRAAFLKLKDRRDNGRTRALEAFRQNLGNLRFFDPACGCGNFLIIAYRELRLLELDVLRVMFPTGQRELDVAVLSLIDVDQFYGIEISEFPARIAEVAMWMMDHIMNNRLSLEFGESYLRIPLKKSPHIHHADALEIDWANVLPPEDCSYVFGNPPFIGHQWRTKMQQTGMHRVWGREGQVNRLDFVTCWFKIAIEYTKRNKKIKIGFVATNSITQGEQASILWPKIFSLGADIIFAHRTFAWGSEARGKAAVHCVVIGLGMLQLERPILFDYEDIYGEPHEIAARQINGYLIDGPRITIPARTHQPYGMPPMFKGSQPTDGARLKDQLGINVTTSNLILDAEERRKLLAKVPKAEKWLRPFVGGEELISGALRWCLWLKEADPAELKTVPQIIERLKRVREGRLKSSTPSVRDFANYPTLFTQDRQPNSDYIAVPRVSSERRQYIPISILSPYIIAHEKLLVIPEANTWIFSLLTSAMHMSWMRAICGRLESRYSYAPTIYNSFPWPEINDAQRKKLEALGQAVLDARLAHPGSTLADLYDPDTMPPDLRKAHKTLDLAVDKLYRPAPFASDRERVEHLFGLYEKLAAPALAVMQAKVKKKRK